MKYLVVIGRFLYSIIFILAGPEHFMKSTIAYAASAGVIMPNLLVPCSGILATLGGLSVLLGYKAKWGALFLVAFLVPVTLVMHKFWGLNDPAMASLQQIMFLKNSGLLGGALFILYFGSGALSLKK